MSVNISQHFGPAKMDEHVLERLYCVWQRIQGREVERDVADNWWSVICKRYTEPQRHYHTLIHIDHMVALSELYAPKLTNPRVVNLAIFFHDIIYDPKATDNEEQSAELFRRYSKEANLQDHGSISEDVLDLIMMTKTHQTSAHTTASIYGSEDLHYMLDFDMAVLGWTKQDYEKYAHQIRQEYIHIPENIFYEKRALVLQNFLRTANIFATKEFRDKYEMHARDNIQSEISSLLSKAQSFNKD